ncbi:MAG: tetratricopeptide repeat protein [Myxococcales bacterium]|nr:tetratricopeptide repeat protein [Myxococcales bacterium]
MRLLTLWGPPGIGKTRLARELAGDLKDPVWVALAGARGLAGMQAAVAPLLSELSNRWLVLDSLEHLLDDGEDGPKVVTQLQDWMTSHERASVLVTSRRLLRLPDEHAVALQPLSAESALELFVARVRRHRPDYTLRESERPALLRLVEALDGLPLAVELAASRWDLLGTEGLLERLGKPLEVLQQPRAGDPRHATLRAAIAWSWDLLEPADQHALMALAAFAGPFTAADADALAGPDVLSHLEVLRDSALVQVTEPGRFQLLASVQAYAREHTPEERAEALALAHAEWCIGKHPDWEYGTAFPEERDDLAAAARALVARSDVRAARALLLLGSAAPGQHLALLDEAVGRLDRPLVRRARGRAHRLRGQHEAAAADFDAGLAATPDPVMRAQLQRELGVLHHQRGELEEAANHYAQALQAAEHAGDVRASAVAIGNLGAVDHDLGRYERAEERYASALAGLRRVSDRRAEATVLANQAVLRQEEGQLEAAEAAYRTVLSLHEAAGDVRMRAITEGNLGLLLHELGNPEQARQLHSQAWAHLQDIPDSKSRGLCLARLGAAAAAMGDTEAARRHFQEAARQVAYSEDRVPAVVVDLFEAFLSQAEGRTDDVAKRLERASEAIRISGDARVAARLLRSAVPEAQPALEVGDTWFVPPGGDRADLSRHASVRRMFQALVAARRAEPPVSLDVDGLFEAGWPGERIAVESTRNRVHVNLAKLRTLGLRGILRRTPEGYELDPEVPIRQAT